MKILSLDCPVHHIAVNMRPTWRSRIFGGDETYSGKCGYGYHQMRAVIVDGRAQVTATKYNSEKGGMWDYYETYDMQTYDSDGNVVE